MRSTGRQRGSSLAIVLVLLLILSISAIAAMRSARLTLSLATRAALEEQAFAVATSAIEHSVDALTADPSLLDETTEWELPVTGAYGGGTYEARTRFAEADETCPVADETPMRRLFFETHATGRVGKHAVSHQAQGFFLCRSTAVERPEQDAENSMETCNTCEELQVETLPARTWWTVLEDVP